MPPRVLLSAFRPLSKPLSISNSTHRAFTSTRFLRIKEDADRTPEQVEAAKQDQLKEQKEGKGRWREDLASHGESNIAADKEKVHNHDEHMEDLQKQTAQKGEKGEL
jgi:predicted secreted protein